ncbi:MAG: DUF6524 family protein [Alphaproteobacteria bacterium]|nr:DUF6524 family protein [Alphaproteobacteria bacterium]
MATKLTPGGFLFRWMGALVLVLGTYNPTPYNFITWVTEDATRGEQLPLKLLIAAVIIIGYVIYFRATFESIGFIGIGLALLFFAGIIWLLLDYGILDLREYGTVAWICLFVLATIMAIGMSWSFIRRKISGQVDQV